MGAGKRAGIKASPVLGRKPQTRKAVFIGAVKNQDLMLFAHFRGDINGVVIMNRTIAVFAIAMCFASVAGAQRPGNGDKGQSVQASSVTGNAAHMASAEATGAGDIKQDVKYAASDADVEKWGKWLDDPSLFAREEGADHLARSNNPKAIPYLLKALKDKAPTVRQHPALNLWMFQSERIKPTLIDALNKEKNNDIVRDLVSSLLKIHADENMLIPYIKRLIDIGDRGAQLVVDISDKEHKQKLISYMRKTARGGKSLNAQADSAYVLVRFFGDDPHQYSDIFNRAMDSRESYVRSEAVYGLQKIGGPQAIDKLKKALNDEDGGVGYDAERALKALREKVAE